MRGELLGAETSRARRIDYRIFDVYSELSASERKLADTIVECQDRFASYSAAELARRAGVSKTTAARFFKRLGFASFDEARAQARETPHWGSPLYDERRSSEGGRVGLKSDAMTAHFARDVENLTQTLSFLDKAAVASAVEKLVAARGIWVVGFRNSFALAHYVRGLLLNVRGDVRILPTQAFDVPEDLSSMKSNDVVLAIGFRRRPGIFRAILEAARARGVDIVLVTDKTASRSAEAADVVLRCQNRGAGMFDSYAAGICVLNYLATEVAQKLGDAATSHLEQLEELHKELNDLG